MLLLPRWDGEVGDEEEEGLGQQRGGLVDLYEDGADDTRQGRSVHGVGGHFFFKTEITDPGPGGAVELMDTYMVLREVDGAIVDYRLLKPQHYWG